MAPPIDRPHFKDAAATFEAAMQDAYGKGFDDGREQGHREGYQECLRDAARLLAQLNVPLPSPAVAPPPLLTEAEQLAALGEVHHHARSKKPRAARGTVDVP